MKNNWHKSGNTFRLEEISQQLERLPVSVYLLRYNQRIGFYLEQIEEAFPLPSKIYGLCDKFVERVLKTWNSTSSNLGVLFNGIKGTGKTVTCEIIANKINLPIIIVDTAFDDVDSLLANIQQDVVLFFDEFEKVFPREWNSPGKLLTLMDGVTKGVHRKLFLLTTNELSIDPNMIQRPGRIRYVKTFGNLQPEVIYEIVEDRLQDKSFTKQVIDFISELELITVDIVCSIVDEVNIHGETPDKFKDVFNVKKLAELHAVFEVFNDENGKMLKETLVFDNVKTHPHKIDSSCEGEDFYINKEEIGSILEVLAEDLIVVQAQPSYEEVEKAQEEGKELPQKPKRTFRLETRSSYNRVFSSQYRGSTIQSLVI